MTSPESLESRIEAEVSKLGLRDGYVPDTFLLPNECSHRILQRENDYRWGFRKGYDLAIQDVLAALRSNECAKWWDDWPSALGPIHHADWLEVRFKGDATKEGGEK